MACGEGGHVVREIEGREAGVIVERGEGDKKL